MLFPLAPFALALIVQAVILGIYAIVAILSVMGRDAAQDANDHVKEHVTALRTMQVDVDMLLAAAQDPGVKASLKKLSDTVRYSDPMSTPAVADVENEIRQAISELRILCENNQTEGAILACRRLEMLFLRRNQLLKASK